MVALEASPRGDISAMPSLGGAGKASLGAEAEALETQTPGHLTHVITPEVPTTAQRLDGLALVLLISRLQQSEKAHVIWYQKYRYQMKHRLRLN